MTQTASREKHRDLATPHSYLADRQTATQTVTVYQREGLFNGTKPKPNICD